MMRRYGTRVGVIAFILAWSGCGADEKAVNRVGVNVVEKALFQDSWYMARTVIDVDYQASALGTFPGDVASDAAQSFTALPRIRWVIDEDFLFAYRDYKLTKGADGESKGPAQAEKTPEQAQAEAAFGEPVAAFAIQKHFDIAREYNPSTGEQSNVVVENDSDRRWYERQYMRVDWSKNLLPGFYGQTYNLYELLGVFKREPADLLVQNESAFPPAWRPRFDRMRCDGPGDQSEDCTQAERDFADQYEKDELYHLSFVTQELLSPGQVPSPDPANAGQMVSWCAEKLYSDAPACSAVASYVRTSFLKVSEKREYEPVNWVDSRFERFGYFRLEQPTSDRSTGKPDDPAFFATDFLNYNVNRHNIWKKWFDEAKQPLPYDKREVRQIVWYTTPELPAHLMKPSFDVVAQWNTIFMETVRELRGQPQPTYPQINCQTEDPDGYCFCQADPTSGEIIQPTCQGQYDPFQSPEEAAKAGVVNPYQCWINAPADAEPDLDQSNLSDTDFNKWFEAKFEGAECVNVLRANSCNHAARAAQERDAPELICQERGDLRFKFISYVEQPGTGFLGVATLRGDPETGEILTGDANIGGPALDGYRTSALQTYDLVRGALSESDIVAGEDVRGYFENLGRIEQPARPRSGYSVAAPAGSSSAAVTPERTRTEIDNRMTVAMKRLERLKGPEGRKNIMTDRMQKLVGTDIERRLVAGSEGLIAAGLAPDTQITEAVLERASPFRNEVGKQIAEARAVQEKLSRANVEMPNEYIDNSVSWFVNKHQNWSRARLEFTINRLLYRQTQLHELGHCLGLRHDFGGTADSDHYDPDYYRIIQQFPDPDPLAFDLDGSRDLNADEQLAFDRAESEVRKNRELAGIDGAMSSSVMDYTANWYERLQPLGRYDRAAIIFGYGDLVEAYDLPDPSAQPAVTGPRALMTSYQGGEWCQSDADCPYSATGSKANFLGARNRDAGLVQSCIPNPNPRTAAQPNSTPNVCSNFDADLASLAVSYAPLKYRFCTDDRADTTLAWCNRFDEGANYRDIVRNVTEDYDRAYPFAAFRRYRKNFSVGTYRDSFAGRRLTVLQNIYQNLLYEYTSNPEFRQRDGNFGFYDQFLATTDILNFYARVLAQPDIGNYSYNPQTATFSQAAQGSPVDLPVPLGLGRYYYSDYQAGLSGIERIERVGSIYDKVTVLQAMTMRGFQPSYTRDVPFYANFYDLFPNEMQQIFNGMIRAYPKAYSARVVCEGAQSPCTNPRLIYMDFYRGDCSRPETCEPSPEVTYGSYPTLDGGGSIYLQLYAALFGLQNFPVYFDTSFQNQLFVCIEGNGDCFAPGGTAVEGTDYVRYTSPRYRRSFLAFQLEPSEGVAEQSSIGFDMVKEARDLNSLAGVLGRLLEAGEPFDPAALSDEDRAQLTALEYVPPTAEAAIQAERQRIQNRLTNSESFFNQIIEFERDLGILHPGTFQ